MRNAAIVRNPLLVLPEVGAAAEMLTDGERTFWRAVSVYTRHAARLLQSAKSVATAVASQEESCRK